jgi:hypothetical protein
VIAETVIFTLAEVVEVVEVEDSAEEADRSDATEAFVGSTPILLLAVVVDNRDDVMGTTPNLPRDRALMTMLVGSLARPTKGTVRGTTRVVLLPDVGIETTLLAIDQLISTELTPGSRCRTTDLHPMRWHPRHHDSQKRLL